MDATSVTLIIDLVAEGIGVAAEIADLARRVQKGEVISDAEIDVARTEINAAMNDWNAEKERRNGKNDD